MNLKFAAVLILYWSIWIMVSTIGVSDGSNPLIAANMTANAQINSTAFDSSTELDSGGFFTTLSGIFIAMGRFFAFTLFGLSPAITGLSQIIVSTWSIAWTTMTIAFVIDAVWSG